MKPWEVLTILGATAVFFAIEANNRPDAQEWSLKNARDPREAHFTITVRKTRPMGRHHWSNSNDVPWSSIHGLTPDDLGRLSGAVKFTVVRDAGTLVCEGRTSLGRASGTFTFEPGEAFGRKLGELGYFPPDAEQSFSLMLHDVTLDFARLVADAGLRATTDELIQLRSHGVTAKYIAEVRASGFGDLHVKTLIDFRNHGVGTDFLREIKASGFEFSPRDVIELRNHGISADYLSDIKSAGFGSLTADQIRDLRNHGVEPSMLRALHESGYKDIEVREVIRLRDHGVPADFLRQSRELGYAFSPEDLVKLRNNGVDSGYLRKLKEAGFDHLEADQIVKLRQHGVD